MKKLTLVAALVASAFAAGANAATTSANVSIAGKIVPSSCTITATGNGGTINFGTIKTSELTTAISVKKQSGNLSVTCESETTAIIKVSGGNGTNTNTNRFNTDKDFVDYYVIVKDVTVNGGNASSTILVPQDKDATVNIDSLGSTPFQRLGSGATAVFPTNGQYFGMANGTSTTDVGTFKTLNANLEVTAAINKEAAKTATSGGEQPFSSVVNFELSYI